MEGDQQEDAGDFAYTALNGHDFDVVNRRGRVQETVENYPYVYDRAPYMPMRVQGPVDESYVLFVGVVVLLCGLICIGCTCFGGCAGALLYVLGKAEKKDMESEFEVDESDGVVGDMRVP